MKQILKKRFKWKILPHGFDFPNGKSREEWNDGNEEI